MRQQEMENKEPMDQSPEETVEAPAPEAAEAQEPAPEEEAPQPAGEAEKLQEALREKENAWATAKAETIKELLPVYDNLERALKQETCDEAYAKGVQMTMTQLKTVLEKLGVEEIPAQGQPFDPNLHNAVMHMEDEAFGENIVAEVFQAGFKLGEKVIRHALVKVAN